MEIGPYQLDNNVALAPMAGVTDLPFRKLCRKLGAGYVVGEMLGSDPSLRNSEKSRLRGVHTEEPLPRAIQIVGWDPKMMAEAAKYNCDQGASVIDINMGCPAKKVCKRAAGSALLGDEKQVAAILQSVVAAVSVPVTLKIRTGLCPSSRNGVTVAKIAEECGISALAVHGRTRACKYNGIVEFDTIRDICSEVDIPVFANGDIESYRQGKEVLRYTGATGLMVGRGAHGAPWFPGNLAKFLASGIQSAAPSWKQQGQIVSEHMEEMYGFYGIERGVRIARKHIKWYTQNHPNAADFCRRVNQTNCHKTQLTLVSDYYRNHPNNDSNRNLNQQRFH